MAQRKVYRSLVYKDLDTYIVVNGNKVRIEFRGGSLQPPINGIFVATDPDVIRAIDKDSGLGRSFICISSEGEPDPEPKDEDFDEDEPEEEPVKKPAKKTTPKPPVLETPPEAKLVEGVTTIQDAREYLLKNIEGLKPQNIPNPKSVENLAAKNGIVFPDLKY